MDMDLFIPNAIMHMSAHQQMMMQQQMMLDYGPYMKPRKLYTPDNYNDISNKQIIVRGLKNYNYGGNNFGYIPEPPPLFDDIEIIDLEHQEILCYIKVEITDENSVLIKCEVKQGYMYEEDVRENIYSLILTSLKNGFSNISAAIGQNDEIAGKILGELGFEYFSNDSEKGFE